MVQRTLTVVFVSALMASAGGCGVFHALVYEPFGPYRVGDRVHRGDGCGEPCGGCASCAEPGDGCSGGCRGPVYRGGWCPLHRVYGCRICAVRAGGTCGTSCGEACGEPCGGACGEPCGGACCGECGSPCNCWRPGPLTWLFRWFGCGTFCGSGCGPRYWGDWYGDPPDLCDPCDRCGNYIGGPHGCSHCGAAGGCSSCGGEPGYAMTARPAGMGYAKAARPAGTCSNCGRTVARTQPRTVQPGTPANSYSSAPRVISQTDRAISRPTDRVATPGEDDDSPHLAQPNRIVPR